MTKKPEAIQAPEPKAKEVLVKTALSDAEWERRTKLCVSNPEYINPSYDR
ncbi:MAG: hypothetical protein V4440_04705 [Pseudomonadota bacterium]